MSEGDWIAHDGVSRQRSGLATTDAPDILLQRLEGHGGRRHRTIP